MTREEEQRFCYSEDIKTGMDLGLGCLPNDLDPEDPVGQVADGPLQAVLFKGLVHWPFGAPELKEADEGKEAKEANESGEDEGAPEE